MIAVAALALVFQVIPLVRAHAHNDYAQPRPLDGALSRGFCSIEADVFLVDGKLLVGHSRKELVPNRELGSMYLAPLAARVAANRGSVYASKAEVNLLVDIKSDGPAVYEVLKTLLVPYRSMLTSYRKPKVVRRAVTIVLSGERPIDMVTRETERWAFIDGRPDEPSVDPNVTPLVSADWSSLFHWNGQGVMPVAEKLRLSGMVSGAHVHGQRLRFWGTPDTRDAWKTLLDAGVDLIGTDRQDDLAEFLRRAQ